MKLVKSGIFHIKSIKKSIKNKLQSVNRIKRSSKKRRLKVSNLPRVLQKHTHLIANTSGFDVPDMFYRINLFNNGYPYLLEGIWQAFRSIRDFARDLWDFMKTVKVYVMSLRGLAKGAATMKHWLKSYLRPR